MTFGPAQAGLTVLTFISIILLSRAASATRTLSLKFDTKEVALEIDHSTSTAVSLSQVRVDRRRFHPALAADPVALVDPAKGAWDASDGDVDSRAETPRVYVSPPGVESWHSAKGLVRSPIKMLVLLALVIVIPCSLSGLWNCIRQALSSSETIKQKPEVPQHEADLQSTSGVGGRTNATFSENKSRLMITAFIASLCHFCMSYYTGIIAGSLLFIEQDSLFKPVGSFFEGATVAFMPAGAAIGTICGFVTDSVGRKIALLSVALSYIAGGSVMAFAKTIEILALGRAFAGFGAGMSSSLVSLYILELAPAGARGQLGSWAPAIGTFGLVVSFAVSAVCSILPIPNGGWRFQLALGVFPALLVVLLYKKLPETPRWLLSRGRRQEAHASLRFLFPNVSDEDIDTELDHLQEQLGASGNGTPSACTLLMRHWRPYATAAAINSLQQATGINVVLYFGPTILKLAGFSTLAALLTSLAISVAQLCTVMTNIAFVESFGVRPAAISGILVIMVGIGLLSLGFWLRDLSGFVAAVSPPWIVVAGMFLFRAAFSFSMAPLPYIMTSDLFEPEARELGVALSWTANWTTNAVMCLAFPIAVEKLGDCIGSEFFAVAIIFLFFLSFTGLGLGFVTKFLPESPKRFSAWQPLAASRG